MFAWWGRMVYRFRYAVIGVMVALCLGAGAFGISLGKHVTQSGFYDNGSQSVHASVTADQVYGRDTSGHIVAIYTAPEGKTVDDPAFQKKILDNLAQVEKDHPDQILRSIGYFKSPQILTTMADADKQHGFMSIQLKGNDDDTILNNYKAVEGDFNIPGVDVKITGLEPLAAALTGTIGEDQKRAEVAAIPLVCVVLFFVFGTVVAAALPGLIGALTIMGALGIMRLVAEFVPVNFFAQPVVTLMGLGIAVDYGLFIVSRFREEIAEGYDTEAAVRRTVMTSGRTVMFSAVILVASSVPLLLIPLDFLKSITYAIIASVMLAAILSITVLAAILAILGPRVDAVGVKMLVRFAEPDPIISDPANPRSNPLALASIPVGILLPPLGIAFGHIARSRIRTSGERGAGLALIGLVLGYVSLMSALGYGVIALRDAGTIEGTLYWILLGVVIFVSVVIGGLALARAVPLLRGPIVWWLNWLADKTQKTKTRAEVEKGFWGKLVNVVMKRPAAFAVPIVIVMIALIIPLGNLALGGISEKYLPPDNSVRQAQQEFDKIFPGFRTDPLTLVIESKDGQPVTDPQIAEVRNQVMAVSGFVDPNNDPAKMWQERPYLDGASKNPSVRVLQNALTNPTDAPKKMAELRALPPPRGLSVSVGGTPALAQDGIQSLYDKLPVMLILLISTTTVLMFLAFGSLVLPIKAAVMSALTLGSTMGALTWMFIDGHGSGLMNYTPQPLMAPMIGLIIAVIWGLSTDYEVFLVSRMVEARARGMSTAEAIRIGTATTGRLITGAALVLAVVAGAFVFSDLVMMKYLAFGLLIALLLDATVVRMFLVPAIMKMLGDDCWWAPQWMKRIQERLGLGEVELPDERKRPTAREAAPDSEALVGAGAPMRALPAHDPTHPQGAQRSIAAGNVAPQRVSPPSAAGTTRIPTAATAPVAEPPTTRMPAVPADQTTRMPAAPAEVSTTRTPRVDPSRTSGPHRAPAPARGSTGRGSSATGSREIESWLGDLRGGGAEAAQQGDAKRPPTTGRRQPPPPPAAEPPTTAIPTQRPTEAEPTEKIDLRSEKHEVDENPKRRGGGVSAADLLRREGRL